MGETFTGDMPGSEPVTHMLPLGHRFRLLTTDDWLEIGRSNPFGRRPELESMLGVLIAEMRETRVAMQRLVDLALVAQGVPADSSAAESRDPAPRTAAAPPSSAPSTGRAP